MGGCGMSSENWKPKTSLGIAVFEGRITSLDEIFAEGKKIKEAPIVDRLVPGLRNEIIFIGGSPGKGGGIKRTPTRRTARMHRSGRRYKVSALVVVGNGNGYIGAGRSVSIEHKVAIDKATEVAKLNIIPVKRGCGSWECGCGQEHSIPAKVTGKSGSVSVELIPAPKGIGLCIPDEGKKMMRLAGIKDIWARSYGNTGARVNYALALYDAFKELNKMKLKHDVGEKKEVDNQ
jgi:small subunit ribosomal protein S5